MGRIYRARGKTYKGDSEVSRRKDEDMGEVELITLEVDNRDIDVYS